MTQERKLQLRDSKINLGRPSCECWLTVLVLDKAFVSFLCVKQSQEIRACFKKSNYSAVCGMMCC